MTVDELDATIGRAETDIWEMFGDLQDSLSRIKDAGASLDYVGVAAKLAQARAVVAEAASNMANAVTHSK